MFDIDLDQAFSYNTYKVVRVVDRYLGITRALLLLLLGSYIGFIALWYAGGAYDIEFATGDVTGKVKGTSYSVSPVSGEPVPWDATDVTVPDLVSDEAFVATRLVLTDNQRRGVCGDPSVPCHDDDACAFAALQNPLVTGQCDKDHSRCLVHAWCPFEDERDARVSQTVDLQGVGNFTVLVRGTIQFAELDSPVFATGKQPVRSGPGQTLWTLSELLALANTTLDRVAHTGATLQLQFHWDCTLDDDIEEDPDLVPNNRVVYDHPSCRPHLHVNKLTDFYTMRQSQLRHLSGNATETGQQEDMLRNLRKMYGLRLTLQSRGIGRRVSFVAIMAQVASGIALIGVVNAVVDCLMLRCMPRRRHYKAVKVEETVDFSDLLAVEQYNDAEETAALLHRASSSAGAGVASPTYRQGDFSY